MLALAEENSHVRSEEFVSGADEKVAIERGHVDQAVRAVVYGVDVGERSGGVRQADDLFDGIDRADRVRSVADRDEFGFGIELRCEILDVERAVSGVDFCPTNRHAFFFEREPGGDVGVVIEARDQDFVAGAEVAADRARHRIGQRGHVGAEDDFIGAAVQKVSHGGAGFGEHGVSVAAGRVGSAGVGVVAAR